MKKAKQKYIYAVGRRRTASARVRLYKGKGENTINEKAISDYFPGEINKARWIKPYEVTDTLGKYYFSVKIIGSGKESQLDALVHGLARAFVKADPEKFKSSLRAAGLLTRDPRERQRRMVGMGGKARRKKQSPKR